MLYLLDANVLITAQNQYYPIDMVPEFWEFLLHMARNGNVKMPIETFDEVKEGDKKRKDALSVWIREEHVEEFLLLDEEADADFVQSVLLTAYAHDLTDTEIEQIGEDPFLVAYALIDPLERCVVSNEAVAPGKKRANRRVPNACADMGISSCNTFAMLRHLGFTTGWKRPHDAGIIAKPAGGKA